MARQDRKFNFRERFQKTSDAFGKQKFTWHEDLHINPTETDKTSLYPEIVWDEMHKFIANEKEIKQSKGDIEFPDITRGYFEKAGRGEKTLNRVRSRTESGLDLEYMHDDLCLEMFPSHNPLSEADQVAMHKHGLGRSEKSEDLSPTESLRVINRTANRAAGICKILARCLEYNRLTFETAAATLQDSDWVNAAFLNAKKKKDGNENERFSQFLLEEVAKKGFPDPSLSDVWQIVSIYPVDSESAKPAARKFREIADKYAENAETLRKIAMAISHIPPRVADEYASHLRAQHRNR